jgi:GAF domain-containing protein
MSSPRPPSPSGDPFAALGTIVLGAQPLPQILEQVVHLAKQVLPPTLEASITLVDGHGPHTVAFTGEPALALGERQYENESGPCLQAAAEGQTIVITDTGREGRWPQYAAAAVAAGVASSLSVPLPIRQQVTGALNFYGAKLDAFDAEMIDLAETFAGHAAVAVTNAHLYESTARLAEQMQQAMTTRAVIEQAKGILMRDHSCSADEAFDMLVRTSQNAHIKLREVAQRLVDSVTSDDAG